MMDWASQANGAKRLPNLPYVTADNTVCFVHTKTGATLRAQPLGIFLGNIALQSDSLDACKVCNDAHPIFHLVPIIKMEQIGARVLGARKAEPVTTNGKLSAVLDDTGEASV